MDCILKTIYRKYRVGVFSSRSAQTTTDKDQQWLKYSFYILAGFLIFLGVIFIIAGCSDGETEGITKEKLLERDKDAQPIAIPVTVG